ncbi:hypothetical protein AALB53_16500 [Lachnospiraceae bacterium 47-T17]
MAGLTQSRNKHSTVAIFAALVIVLTVVVSGVMLFRNANEVNAVTQLSDAIQSGTYADMSRIESLLLAKNFEGAADELITQVDTMMINNGIEISDDQRQRIRSTFRNLVESLYSRGYIETNGFGGLNELSRAYVSNAASYAVTFVIGDGAVEMIGTVLGDVIDTNNIENSIKVIKQSYENLAKIMLDDSGQPYNLNDLNAQLNALAKAAASNDSKLATVSKLAIQVDALETMLDGIKGKDASGIDLDGFSKDSNAKLAEMQKKIQELESKISSAKEFDSSKLVSEINNLSDELNTMGQTVASLQQSNVQQTIADISSDIDKKAESIKELSVTVSSLQSSLSSIDSNVAKESGKISDLSSELTDLSKSLASVKSELTATVNSQNSDFSKWKDTSAKSLQDLDKKIQELTAKVNNNANVVTPEVTAALTKLENSVASVETTISKMDSTDQVVATDLSKLKVDLAALQKEIGSLEVGGVSTEISSELNSLKDQLQRNTNDIKTQDSNISSLATTSAELQYELSSIQDMLSISSAPLYDSGASYVFGQYVLGSDGLVYRYIGKTGAAAALIPDPTTVSYVDNRSTYWERTSSGQGSTQQIAQIQGATKEITELLNSEKHDATAVYLPGDCVYDADSFKFYVCITKTPVGTPVTDRTYWKEAANGSGLSDALGEINSSIDKYNDAVGDSSKFLDSITYFMSNEYKVGDYVWYNDQLFICINDTTGPFDYTSWQLVDGGGSMGNLVLVLNSLIDGNIAAVEKDIDAANTAIGNTNTALNNTISDLIALTSRLQKAEEESAQIRDDYAKADTNLRTDFNTAITDANNKIASLQNASNDYLRSIASALGDSDIWLYDIIISSDWFIESNGSYVFTFEETGATEVSDITIQYVSTYPGFDPVYEQFDGGFRIILNAAPEASIKIRSVHIENQIDEDSLIPPDEEGEEP